MVVGNYVYGNLQLIHLYLYITLFIYELCGFSYLVIRNKTFLWCGAVSAKAAEPS